MHLRTLMILAAVARVVEGSYFVKDIFTPGRIVEKIVHEVNIKMEKEGFYHLICLEYQNGNCF